MKTLTEKQLEKIILDTCYDAGRYVKERAFGELETQWKKKDDPVTKLDREAEQIIRKAITKHIDATIYGEEYGQSRGKSGITIYVDPIDGTKSFVKKEFFSSTSIAAEINGEIMFGCVYDFMRGIMYFANREGAFITYNGKTSKLPMKDIPKLSKPAIYFRDSDDGEKDLSEEFDGPYNVRKQIGSIALTMAQLASGSYNGMILSPLKHVGTHDIAAGYYIMKQAGVYITNYKLEPFDHKKPLEGIIALDKRVKKDAVEIIKDNTDPQRIAQLEREREDSVLRAYAACEERRRYD